MIDKLMEKFNPLIVTDKIHREYIEFFKTSFALENKELSRRLESLSEGNLLWKPPFISISQNFKTGQDMEHLCEDIGIDKEVLLSVGRSRLYTHQELAIKNISLNSRHTVISASTGSGKTEGFVIPIMNECVKHDNEKGIKAIIVYPRNALANDQVERIRGYLYKLNAKRRKLSKREITFGIYTGETYESINDKEFRTDIKTKCPSCENYELHPTTDGNTSFYVCSKEKDVRLDYEIITRKELRDNPPDILITNFMQLEYILPRQKDNPLFEKNLIKFIVFDEIHDYGGAQGLDVSILIRRLRNRIYKTAAKKHDIICIGTSATMSKAKSKSERQQKIAIFASKLFGVPFVSDDIIEGDKIPREFPSSKPLKQLQILKIPERLEDLSDIEFKDLCIQINSETQNVNNKNKAEFLGKILLENSFFKYMIEKLDEPTSIEVLRNEILTEPQFRQFIQIHQNNEDFTNQLMWSYLRVASLSLDPSQTTHEPLVRTNVHNFFRGIPQIFICTNPQCKKNYFVQKEICEICQSVVEQLGVCRVCSREFYVIDYKITLNDLENLVHQFEEAPILEKIGEHPSPIPIRRYFSRQELLNNKQIPVREFWYTEKIENDDTEPGTLDFYEYKKCIKCGSFSTSDVTGCTFKINEQPCKSTNFIPVVIFLRRKTNGEPTTMPHECPYCGSSYGAGNVITKFDMTPQQAAVNFFNLVYDYLPNKKLLIFTDSRQDASRVAGYLEDAHEDTALKQLIFLMLTKINHEKKYVSFREITEDHILPFIEKEWFNHRLEDFDRENEQIEKDVLREFTSPRAGLSLEWQGLLEFNYLGLITSEEFRKEWDQIITSYQPTRNVSRITEIITSKDPIEVEKLRYLIITILNMMRRDGALQGLERRDYYERTLACGFRFEMHDSPIKTPEGSGIEIKNIHSKNQRYVKYIKKVFELKDDLQSQILLEYIWNFMTKGGYIVNKSLSKYSTRDSVQAYVVSTGKMRISLPQTIHRCNRCRKIYTNIPVGVCPNIIRLKLCKGKTLNISFEEFSRNNNSHFFTLFTTKYPSRMATVENTGFVPKDIRKRNQAGFMETEQQKRTVDVTVATPTLELGMDIGDLSAIGLYKSPPSPINYLQRVGRAGRRDGISFINTFLFDTPIDEFNYRNPQDLIRGEINPPNINFENIDLIMKHVNALILQEVFTKQENDRFPERVIDVVNNREEFLTKMDEKIAKHKESISRDIKDILDNIPDFKKNFEITDKQINDYLKIDFRRAIEEALDEYAQEMESCLSGMDQYVHSRGDLNAQRRLNQLSIRKVDLEKKNLMNHFHDSGVLPRYAFPGKYVTIESVQGDISEGRERRIAISEFAPRCEPIMRKSIYRCVGVDFDKKVERFFICKSCKKYYSKNDWQGKACPFCNEIEGPSSFESISPQKIYVRKIGRAIGDYQAYVEPNVQIYLPEHKLTEPTKIEYPSYTISLMKHNTVKMLQSVREVFYDYDDQFDDSLSRQPTLIEICDECGKVKEKEHEPRHYNVSQKLRVEPCRGRFQHLTLHNEMLTKVISIKVENKSEEKIDGSFYYRFLMTLKNAIIYAGQLVAEAQEGEIEAAIKENEIILFDNVDGGAGYVDIIFEKFEEVLQKAAQIVFSEQANTGDQCLNGCPRCLWSFRRKRDIRHIDKQLILPILHEAILKERNTDSTRITESLNNTDKPIIEIIRSKAGSLKGAQKIKELLRKAVSRIEIFSPELSNQEINWEDEDRKSWLDILGSIRSGEKSVQIRITTIKPETDNDFSSIIKLLKDGIDVYCVDRNSFAEDHNILDSGLIVIDRHEGSETRNSIQFTSNLTEQIIQNFTTIYLSKDEREIKHIKNSINKIDSFSKKINENDIENLTNSNVYWMFPRDEASFVKAKQAFDEVLLSTKKEIKIMTTYLSDERKPDDNLQFYLSEICQHLAPNIGIKLITNDQSLAVIKNVASFLSNTGHKTEIISYQTEFPSYDILHDRCLIADDQVVIELGKGLRFVYDFKGWRNSKNNTKIVIHKEKEIVTSYNSNFHEFWNYSNSNFDAIKNSRKFDTRTNQ